MFDPAPCAVTSTKPKIHTSTLSSSSSSSSLRSQWYSDRTRSPRMSPTFPIPDLQTTTRSRPDSQIPKRLSVFGARSRNSAAPSIASPYSSPASSMTSVDTLFRRPSQDSKLSHATGPSQKEGSSSKSLLLRGTRILKRRGNKFSISSSLTLDEEDEMTKGAQSGSQRLDGSGVFYRSHRARHSDTRDLKRNISDPFDFQHVTHTSPGQLPDLENSQLLDIATELSVIRASQRPVNELKGIRAENLHSQKYPSDAISKHDASSYTTELKSQYAWNPPRLHNSQTFPNSPSRLGPTRDSRFIENFSRPVSRLSRQHSSPSMIGPPRSSSKLATPDIPEPSPQTIDALLGLHSTLAVPETLYENSHQSTLPMLVFPSDFPDAGNAPITEDGKPAKARSPTSTTHAFDLTDVLEEDETVVIRHSEAHHSGPATDSEPFRFGQSTSRVNIDKPLPGLPVHIDSTSDLLPSPTIPTNGTPSNEYFDTKTKKRESRKRISVMLRPTDDLTWEDDIDYCYKHAAESNSNFDWHRTSFEEPEVKARFERLAPDTWPETVISKCNDTENPNGVAIPAVNQNQENLDESEQSDQTVVAGCLVLEQSSFPAKNGGISPITTRSIPVCLESDSLAQGGYFRSEHVPILSASFDDFSSNQSYDSFIPSDPKFDDGYPLYTQTPVVESFDSSHGSSSPMSKYNSQESIISHAASVARKHHSSLSTTSVPDLVHSPSCSLSVVDRDSMSSTGEQPKQSISMVTPISHPLIHQCSKSLARELTQQRIPSISPSGGDYSSDISPHVPMAPVHDRAKSASALDMLDTSSSKNKVPEGRRKRSATVTRGPSGQKTRKSYSLFPTAVAGPPSR
ncbi:hypothetical protein GX48_02168 [Paracoccidioides brasiliensis]|nr:hypothetical protein GX48_02168 [Paracoccidioides brasiliensis]